MRNLMRTTLSRHKNKYTNAFVWRKRRSWELPSIKFLYVKTRTGNDTDITWELALIETLSECGNTHAWYNVCLAVHTSSHIETLDAVLRKMSCPKIVKCYCPFHNQCKHKIDFFTIEASNWGVEIKIWLRKIWSSQCRMSSDMSHFHLADLSEFHSG